MTLSFLQVLYYARESKRYIDQNPINSPPQRSADRWSRLLVRSQKVAAYRFVKNGMCRDGLIRFLSPAEGLVRRGARRPHRAMKRDTQQNEHARTSNIQHTCGALAVGAAGGATCGRNLKRSRQQWHRENLSRSKHTSSPNFLTL